MIKCQVRIMCEMQTASIASALSDGGDDWSMTFGVGAHLMAMIGTYLICQAASTKCTVRRGGHSTALWEMSKSSPTIASLLTRCACSGGCHCVRSVDGCYAYVMPAHVSLCECVWCQYHYAALRRGRRVAERVVCELISRS